MSRPPPSLPEIGAELRRLADLCDAAGEREADGAGSPGKGERGSLTTARHVRSYLAARRARDALLPGGLFADPAWDMLLDLYACRLENRRVFVTDACIAAAVPPTTGLRWIAVLVDAGAVIRSEDPRDRRRTSLRLADPIAERLGRWAVRHLCPPQED